MNRLSIVQFNYNLTNCSSKLIKDESINERSESQTKFCVHKTLSSTYVISSDKNSIIIFYRLLTEKFDSQLLYILSRIQSIPSPVSSSRETLAMKHKRKVFLLCNFFLCFSWLFTLGMKFRRNWNQLNLDSIYIELCEGVW